MKNQKTQKQYFEEIIALAKANDRDDLAEFAEGRIAQLVKKASSKKPTKAQEANENIKTAILSVLSADKGMTASEVLKASDEFSNFSNQKISALLKQLVESGEVIKTTEKGKSIFTLTYEDEDDDVQALDGEITI